MRHLLEKLYFGLIFGMLTTAMLRIFSFGEVFDTASGHSSSPSLLALNALTIGSTLYFVYPKLPLIWSQLQRLKWMFLLYAWGILSCAWSVERTGSFKFSIYSVIYLLAAAYFANRYTPQEFIANIGTCSVGLALLSIPGEFLLPAIDDPAPGWSGILIQKNLLGLCMMIAITFLLAQGKRWNLSRTLILLLYLTLLLLSQSFTAIVATVVIVFFVASSRIPGWARLTLWVILGGALCSLFLVGDPVSILLGAGGKQSNLTGRDVIWAFALKGIIARPIIGHGFGGAFWGSESDSAMQELNWNPRHAHNGILELWLQLGIVGVILFVGFLAASWRRIRRLQKAETWVSTMWMQLLLIAVLAHSLMEADFMATNILWFLLVVASFSGLRMEQQATVNRWAASSLLTRKPDDLDACAT